MRRNGKTRRFTLTGPEVEKEPQSESAAYALALDLASRLDEPGSVNVREWGELIAVARGDGAGGAVLFLGSASTA